MSYSYLVPLMKEKGCTISPEKFQERVNVVFHNYEASLYDEMHKDMKNSLQEQVDLLVKDLLSHSHFLDNKLRLLDIGCGTGLSSEFLINSKLGPYIHHITLIDTSEKMLEYAGEKAANWKKEYTTLNSSLSGINAKFDVVMICSVLHHIPDLKSFLTEIDSVLKKDGVLFHLQDPNGDYLDNESYLERLKSFKEERQTKSFQSSFTGFIPKKIKSKINRFLGRKNYIDLINDQLIREGIIKKRMSADELWSVTDIHVPSSKDRSGKGISLKFLKQNLKNFTLVNKRSYGFFGKLKFDLDPQYAKIEEEYIDENRLDGRNLSAVWKKKN